MMKSSYPESDVMILLKDISGQVTPLPTSERERLIQSGTHYCEMLPIEYEPSEKYLQAYQFALSTFSKATAEATMSLAEKLYEKKGDSLVIISLARAGIPIGILVKRYLKMKYHVDIPHYSISIIRGRGIDINAMNFILSLHRPSDLQFVDGWIGKGAILGQLREALKAFPLVDSELGVVSDPANLTELCGTHDDILIPSSCLNATITGLISRTFLRADIISANDFHGAAFYSDLACKDLSNSYLDTIESFFSIHCQTNNTKCSPNAITGAKIAAAIKDSYQIGDINFVKPGIGETTRVLLRRIPWKIIVNPLHMESKELKHIFQLAEEKNIPIEPSSVNLFNYKVCGLIKSLSDV